MEKILFDRNSYRRFLERTIDLMTPGTIELQNMIRISDEPSADRPVRTIHADKEVFSNKVKHSVNQKKNER